MIYSNDIILLYCIAVYCIVLLFIVLYHCCISYVPKYDDIQQCYKTINSNTIQ